VAEAGKSASRRGDTKFTANDLLFQLRKDSDRQARLRNIMRWGQLRKQVKDNDNASDPKPEALNELIDAEDEEGDDEASTEELAETASGSNHVALAKGVRPLPQVPWSTPYSFFPASILAEIPAITRLATEEDLESEHTALLHQLEADDIRTRDMTADEYKNKWCSARSASFTHNQKTRFRTWCGLGSIADYMAKEDVCVSMLAALVREWVQDLTNRAMAIAAAAAAAAARQQQEESCPTTSKKRKLEGPCPFVKSPEQNLRGGDVPIEPFHARKAFELLTTPRIGYTGMAKRACLGQRKNRRMVSYTGNVQLCRHRWLTRSLQF
jgi:hypothetical protein